MAKIVGIDLGTTNSVIALVEKGVQLRQNKEQETLTPSVVAYRSIQNKDVYTVGRQAKNIRKMAPDQYICSIKRLMGRGFQDAEVRMVASRFPYKIVKPSHGTAEGVAVVLGTKEFAPDDISSMILGKLKSDVEQSIADKVTHAVITVPAYFSEKQKMATYSAAIKAGLIVLHLLPEPTAAAIAYGLQQMDESAMPKMVLVYDLGGGTFDLTLLMMTQGVYSPLNNGGDMWLGGDDFDDVISKRVIEHVRGKYRTDPTSDASFMAELAEEARKAKEELCGTADMSEVFFSIKNASGQTVTDSVSITREQFVEDITPLADKIDRLVDDLLVTAAVKNSDVSTVLQVGNGSLIPLLQERLDRKFPGRVDRRMQAKHCVAMGAAMLAATLRGMICPRDNTLNELGAKRCKDCGQPFEATAICPNPECGCEISPADPRCPHCKKAIAQAPDKIAPLYYGLLVADGFRPFINRGEPLSLARSRPPQVVHPPYEGARMVALSVYGRENLDGTGNNEKQCEAFAVLPPGLSAETGIRLRIWLNENELFELSAVLENGADLKPRMVRGGDVFQKVIRDLEQYEEKAAEEGAIIKDPTKAADVQRKVLDHLAQGRAEEAAGLTPELLPMIGKVTPGEITREQLANLCVSLYGQLAWVLPDAVLEQYKTATVAIIRILQTSEWDAFDEAAARAFGVLEQAGQAFGDWMYDRTALRNLAKHDPAQANQLEGEIQQLAGQEIQNLMANPGAARPNRSVWRSLQTRLKQAVAKLPEQTIPCPKCSRPVPRGPRYCPNCSYDLWTPR